MGRKPYFRMRRLPKGRWIAPGTPKCGTIQRNVGKIECAIETARAAGLTSTTVSLRGARYRVEFVFDGEPGVTSGAPGPDAG